MANDLIPDYILLKEAAKDFRTEVDSILSLAGEGNVSDSIVLNKGVF